MIKEGFVPSGQSAVTFAALTAIWINSKDIVTFTLALVLSLLVVGNRVYNNARTKAEVVFGACMGVLIVMLVYGLTIFKNTINKGEIKRNEKVFNNIISNYNISNRWISRI